MRKSISSWLYYLLFLFIGYFIYKFQIERSFTLFAIYTLCVSFSFLSFLFNVDPKKTLPVLFVCCLFVMYGITTEEDIIYFQPKQFILLLSIFLLVMTILLSRMSLLFKKISLVFIGTALGAIYLINVQALAEYKFIPFVIGSFFMFRCISFLHEIKFLKKPIPLIDNINYFLMSPNFSMPLFPIVDYKSFITSYEGISTNTLRRASLFICRGLLQLLLYRFIYHWIIIPFNEIHTALDALIFLVANFMIVLRVIGAFHIAIGLVILSGYNIPDLFNNIFFSTGFSDLWRRTNIYWRNFIIKIFYYPIYFKIKKIGVYPALFISTLACFFITWILHAYQWFWIKGFIPIEIKDVIFWGSFGLLVAINTLIQQKKLDNPTPKKELRFNFIRQAFSGLLVLFTMSFLWSIWTCNSLSYWWRLMGSFKNFDMHQLQIISLLSLGYITVASMYHYYEKNKEGTLLFLKRNMKVISYGGFIILFATLQATNLILLKKNSRLYRRQLMLLISERLNKADQLSIDNGYYTNLISTNNYCSQIWNNDFDVTRNWTKYISANTTKPSYDLMITAKVPHASVKYKDITYTLNSIGLRDKEYPKIKPDSCYRIIIIGGSYECGNGINDGEDFISVVEKRLNENYVATKDGKRVNVELINFSSNGYHLIQRFYEYKDNARYWKPDAVFLFIHTNYRLRMARYVNRLVNRDFPINDLYLKNIVDKFHVDKSDDAMVVEDMLGSYADSINYYSAREISKIAHQDSAKLFVIFLPVIRDRVSNSDSTFLKNICNNYDMEPISMADVFVGYKIQELALSDQDFHPNKKATALIADRFLEDIIKNQNYFNIQFNKK